ncbi:post-segregation antitoxin CcdA (plasmid) [Alphaproteobacteria bacterium AO1-B]|nr:post-segregation antitoxin CcdA [Alphaproteobacteria bacterium AO1-B]
MNISQAAEEGILLAVSRSMADQWRQEDQSALKSSNVFVVEHDLPLAKSQLF